VPCFDSGLGSDDGAGCRLYTSYSNPPENPPLCFPKARIWSDAVSALLVWINEIAYGLDFSRKARKMGANPRSKARIEEWIPLLSGLDKRQIACGFGELQVFCGLTKL